MAKYLNLAGLQTLWAKLKDTFALKKHSHDDMADVAPGGIGSASWTDDQEIVVSSTYGYTASYKSAYRKKTSLLWNYIKGKLGISSAVGSTTNPVYVDTNGQLKAVGGTMLKQGSLIDTHSEGSRTILIDGTNELFAFYDRGGTCTAYEYDLEWSSSSPAPAGTFSPADLSSHKTTASVANIAANVFNSLTGYNQSAVYSGTKYAVYDLKLPASFSHGTTFYWSFGNANWKPHYFEVLVWKDNATQYPNGYISKYRSTNVGAYGSVAVSVGATEGNSFTHIRIVMDKYSRLAAFGVVNYSSTGLATNYMSRTVDKVLYRSISVAKNNTYNLGSSSAKWANIYATNFNGALKGNADTATKATQDGSGNVITSKYVTLDTTQTISGSKTFSQPVNIVQTLGTSGSTAFGVDGGNGKVALSSNSNGKRGIYLYSHGTDASGKWAIEADANNNVTMNGNVIGNVTGTATKALTICRNNTARQSSINLAHESGGAGNALTRVDLVTSAISAANGSPKADGFVMTFNWDTTSAYDTQIFIPNDFDENEGMPKIRFRDNKSEWGTWSELSIGGNAATASAAKSGSALESVISAKLGNEKLKDSSNTSSFSDDDESTYTGKAIADKISAAMSGSIGGWLGNLSVAQINAKGTNLKSGDYTTLTDSGTITRGNVSVSQGDDVYWIASSQTWGRKNNANCVTINGNQTITGAKLFSTNPRVVKSGNGWANFLTGNSTANVSVRYGADENGRVHIDMINNTSGVSPNVIYTLVNWSSNESTFRFQGNALNADHASEADHVDVIYQQFPGGDKIKIGNEPEIQIRNCSLASVADKDIRGNGIYDTYLSYNNQPVLLPQYISANVSSMDTVRIRQGSELGGLWNDADKRRTVLDVTIMIAYKDISSDKQFHIKVSDEYFSTNPKIYYDYFIPARAEGAITVPAKLSFGPDTQNVSLQILVSSNSSSGNFTVYVNGLYMSYKGGTAPFNPS